ncbi:MAG: hypothetical protein ACR2HG_09920 [Pyrinomonadaceae bacterium]
MFGYQNLMQEAYLAHENFKNEWKNLRDGKLKKDKKAKGSLEPESVTKLRDDFLQKLNVLYGTKIEPLEKKFRDDPILAMEELIEFLSVDIPAFRCGYAKEVFLQWLKNTELSSKEIKQIQQIALKMCETDNVRREFRRWCRLMIKLADVNFVLKLKNISKSKNLFPRIKSKWMLEMIEQQRLDLRRLIKIK